MHTVCQETGDGHSDVPAETFEEEFVEEKVEEIEEETFEVEDEEDEMAKMFDEEPFVPDDTPDDAEIQRFQELMADTDDKVEEAGEDGGAPEKVCPDEDFNQYFEARGLNPPPCPQSSTTGGQTWRTQQKMNRASGWFEKSIPLVAALIEDDVHKAKALAFSYFCKFPNLKYEVNAHLARLRTYGKDPRYEHLQCVE